MARIIRRRSMERLELYDLDRFSSLSSPPLPPPRKLHYRRPSMNANLERYQFLCNPTRAKIDPIYAATPMFTTIPKSIHDKPQRRQLLGTYIRLENVRPKSVKSPEPETDETETVQSPPVQVSVEEKKGEEKQEEEEEEDDDDEEGEDDDDDDEEDDDDENSFESDDSDDDKNDDNDDILDDDDDRGVVQQIVDRNKSK